MSAHRPGRIARWLLRAPARLHDWNAGWRYDGSDDARRRLVRQLPVLEFRPR